MNFKELQLRSFAFFCWKEKQDYSIALATYFQLMEINPRNANYPFSIAMIYDDINETDKALSYLELIKKGNYDEKEGFTDASGDITGIIKEMKNRL